MIRPRLNWTAATNTTLGFGVDIFTGPDARILGRFNDGRAIGCTPTPLRFLNLARRRALQVAA